MKSILTLLLFLVALRAGAQNYTVSSIPYHPFPFDSGIQVVAPNDDSYGGAVGIGFDFLFFGHPYQQLVVGTNGVVTFNLNLANNYCPWPITAGIPSGANPTESIMPCFEDLLSPAGGSVKHYVFGMPPHRHFVVSYDSIALYNCISQYFTGQMILDEGTNDIEIHIKHKDDCPAWNNGYGIVGIQDSTGTQAYFPAGYNFPVQWTADSVAWIFHPDSVYSPLNPSLNRISGRVFADLNTNCTYDGGDHGLLNTPVIFTNTQTGALQYEFADMQGYFSKMEDTGHYQVSTFNLMNNLYVTTCPAGGHYNIYFPALNDSSDNNNFADTVTLCSDLSLFITAADTNSISSWWGNVLQPCSTNYLFLECMNGGTHGDTATVTVTLNDSTQIISSPVPYQSLGNNQYSFQAGYLAAGATQSVVITIHTGCDTIGSVYCYDGHIDGFYPLDCGNYNNYNAHCIGVGVPYDPNSMYVGTNQPGNALLQPVISAHAGDAFNYLITFQNTGSGIAHQVQVKTLLDPAINPGTVLPTASSAAYQWLILGDTLIFNFPNINLPDSGSNQAGSHGFITFSASQQPNNVAGTVITHTAGIYFDYMPAVVTNPAVVNLVSDPTGVVSESPLNVQVFPNPARDILYVRLGVPSRIDICDLLGRVLQSQEGRGIQPLALNALSPGIYCCRIRSGSKVQTIRFVKQ